MIIFEKVPDFITKFHSFQLSHPCNCYEVDHIHKHCVDCDGILGEEGDKADLCFECFKTQKDDVEKKTNNVTITKEHIEKTIERAFRKVFPNDY
tara:strand:- start:2504 stop:2785 length:282 start_codon:yes stop_codon:yes gene_type:complete